MATKQMYKDLLGRFFVGIVEDNLDPKRLGRVRVRVQTLFDDIATDKLPWASPFINSSSGKKFDLPAVGKVLTITFVNNILYEPYYVNADHFNKNLQNKLESLSDEEYRNFAALVFDHITQIYIDDNSLTLDYLMNKINITNDSIILELKDGNSKIKFGSVNPDQPFILGTEWFDWFDEFLNVLMDKSTMKGSYGAPILKPALDALISEYFTIKDTFVNKKILLPSNNNIGTSQRNPKTVIAQHDFVKINDDLKDYNVTLLDKITTNFNKDKNNVIQNLPTSIEHLVRIDEYGRGEPPINSVTVYNEKEKIIYPKDGGDDLNKDERIIIPAKLNSAPWGEFLTEEELLDIRNKEKIKNIGISDSSNYTPEDLLIESNFNSFYVDGEYSDNNYDVMNLDVPYGEMGESVKSEKYVFTNVPPPPPYASSTSSVGSTSSYNSGSYVAGSSVTPVNYNGPPITPPTANGTIIQGGDNVPITLDDKKTVVYVQNEKYYKSKGNRVEGKNGYTIPGVLLDSGREHRRITFAHKTWIGNPSGVIYNPTTKLCDEGEEGKGTILSSEQDEKSVICNTNLDYQSPKSYQIIVKNRKTAVIPDEYKDKPAWNKYFFERIGDLVVQSCAGTGLYAGITLAQMSIETGYSKHCYCYAGFGVKAGSCKAGKYWGGHVYLTRTPDTYSTSNQVVYNYRWFKAYKTFLDSLKDHHTLLTETTLYKDVPYQPTPFESIREIIACGYGNAWGYPQGIMTQYANYNLFQFDRRMFELEKQMGVYNKWSSKAQQNHANNKIG